MLHLMGFQTRMEVLHMRTTCKFILPLVFLLLLLAACGNKYQGDYSVEVKDFSFTNQDGENVSKSELDGDFWIADFIFTNCETVCPPMTSNMANLQTQLKEAGLDDVRLVSFSVDLGGRRIIKKKEFGESRGASFDNWDLLTGYEFDKIKEFSIKSFKAPLEIPADSDQVMHSVYFYIISPDGDFIYRFDGRKPDEVKKIVLTIQDLK